MRFTIRMKLGLTFAAIIALSAVTAVLGITSLSSLNTSMRQMVAGPVERMQISEELFIDLLQLVRAEKNMILSTAPDQLLLYDKQIQQLHLDFEAKLAGGERVASGLGPRQGPLNKLSQHLLRVRGAVKIMEGDQ